MNFSHKKKDIVNSLLKRRKIGNLPPPFPNSWYAVLESDRLAAKEVKELHFVGQNLVAWRGEHDGRVFVADAYCPHLGANLGVGGIVKGNCIECPFHKWSFDGLHGGAVVNVPYSKQQSSMNKLPGLKLWSVLEANDFIWIWYHVEGNDPTWFPEQISEISSNGPWKYRGRSEFQVTCHIQEIPENGADVAHLSAIHEPPGFFPKKLEALTKYLSKIAKHKWTANWTSNNDPERRHESLIELSHFISLFEGKINLFHMNVNIRQIGSGLVVLQFDTSFGKGVLVQSVTPIEPLLQRICHRFYSEPKFIHPLGLLVLHGEAVQISRDVEIWNRKCYLSSPNLVKEDCKIKSFRKWFSQFYSAEHMYSIQRYYKHSGNSSLEF